MRVYMHIYICSIYIYTHIVIPIVEVQFLNRDADQVSDSMPGMAVGTLHHHEWVLGHSVIGGLLEPNVPDYEVFGLVEVQGYIGFLKRLPDSVNLGSSAETKGVPEPETYFLIQKPRLLDPYLGLPMYFL